MEYIAIRFPGGKPKALTLSYDDGVTTDIRLLHAMERAGIKGTFNINSGLFAQQEREYPEGKWGRMTLGQCRQLYRSDCVEVAAHGMTHPHFEKLPGGVMVEQILSDRKNLEQQFGAMVRGMAYPYGTFSDDVVEAARLCGIVYSRTTRSTKSFALPEDWLRLDPTCHHTDPELPELAARFLNDAPLEREHGWLFYLWGHSYEFSADQNWDMIENLLCRLGGREDVWYATNIEVYDYLQAYHRLVWSADGTTVQNPTVADVWFAVNGRLFAVSAGKSCSIVL